jgi:hypothetical protein
MQTSVAVTVQARPRAAIVFLAPSKRIDEFERSLHHLAVNFNERHQYPVLVFYDTQENIDPKALEERLAPIARAPLHLVPVSDFTAPPPPRDNESVPVHINHLDNLLIAEIPEQFMCGTLSFGMHYRHMCRFWADGIFRHPAMQEYDYYWRFDTDSFLLSPLPFDIFRYMQANR